MNKAIEETNKIYLEGASKVFDFPEFKKIDTAKNFLSILDTKEEMLAMKEKESRASPTGAQTCE